MSDAYIIDPSALIQGYISEPRTPNILALLDQVPNSVELHTSEFCLVECANIFVEARSVQRNAPEHYQAGRARPRRAYPDNLPNSLSST